MILRPANWPAFLTPTEHDWVEDAVDSDNGCYQHGCTECHATFYGHKRRPDVCRVCAIRAEVFDPAVSDLDYLRSRQRAFGLPESP